MDKDLNHSDLEISYDSDNGQSLVGKLKRNVSEIISNTPLSKWFQRKQNEVNSAAVRRRQDDSEDEEDLQELQPPSKRTKLPPTKETLCLNVSEVLSPISSVNNVKKPSYRNFPDHIAGPSSYQTCNMLNSTSTMSESNCRNTKSEGSENVFKNPKTLGGTTELPSKESNSDSEESTSGYSSGRVGSKEIVSQESCEQTSPLEMNPQKNRSLFNSSSSSRMFISHSSTSPNRNSSLSFRMPSFNPSTFGSSGFVDRTLSTKRILNSPFYNGHTIYGGASAYGRSTNRAPQDIQKVLRLSTKIKPVNKGFVKGDLQLGKTARRILDTLEQYSSPISDAKKIPVSSKNHTIEGSPNIFIGANPYTLRESRSVSNRQLQVPSVTNLLKMKMNQQKTKLQDSTEAARQIVTQSIRVSNKESYQIPIQKDNEKHITKIKTKITSVRHKVQTEETVAQVNLTPVSLPIEELPQFDVINVPSPVQNPLDTATSSIFDSCMIQDDIFGKSSEPSRRVDIKGSALSNSKGVSSEFKFSAPVVLAEYLKPLEALNNFKFSEPLNKKRTSIHSELDNQEIKSLQSLKNNGEYIMKCFKPGNMVENIIETFKPKGETWECPVCLIRNHSDKTKCAACESLKPSSKPAADSVQSFTSAIPLKSTEHTWECPTCMIRNKKDIGMCAACEDNNPQYKSNNSAICKVTTHSSIPKMTLECGDSLSKCASCKLKDPQQASQSSCCQNSKSSDTFSCVSSGNNLSGFGTKLIHPNNNWECATCLIRNKEELTKCAACESPKPSPKYEPSRPPTSSFCADFKKKDDEWECQVCMVRNKADVEKCQCCENANPRIKPSSSKYSLPKVSTFGFGIDKNTANSFSFGIPPSAQSSQNIRKTNAGLVFGDKRVETYVNVSKTPSFAFGVPSNDSKNTQEHKKDTIKAVEKTESTKNTLICSLETSEATSGSSSRGVAAKTSEPVPTVNFGSQWNTTEATPSNTNNNNIFTFGSATGFGQTATTTTPAFRFGTTKTSEGSEQNTAGTPTFSCDADAVKSEGAALGVTSSIFTFGPSNKSDNCENVGSKTDGELKTKPLLKQSEKLPDKCRVDLMGFGVAKDGSSAPISSTTRNEISSTDESSPTKRSKPAVASGATKPTFSFKASAVNGNVNSGSSIFSKPADHSKAIVSPVGGFSLNFIPDKVVPASTGNSATVASTFSQSDSLKQIVPSLEFSSSANPSTPANGFSFGPAATAFGSKPTSNAAETKPSGTKAPKSNMFAFGEGKNKTPTFAFNEHGTEGKAATPFRIIESDLARCQPQQACFSFNQSASPSFSFGSCQNNNSVFGAVSPTANPSDTANSKSESVFLAPHTQSSGHNGAFNFGTLTPVNQKAGFSFGATTANSEGPVATQSGFSFGTSALNANAPSSGGFSFSASMPTFNVNTKPSFNFTGGTGIAAFSAPPVQEGSMPQRKIKKAIRRTVR